MNSRVHPKYKTKYRVTNRAEYERGLVQRGDVTVWLSPEAIAAWTPVPPEHIERGYVDRRAPVPIEWLRILRATSEPRDAWLEVEYHRQWFYIAAGNVVSRKAFTLLDAMFSAVVGNVPGGKPLLTLPVN